MTEYKTRLIAALKEAGSMMIDMAEDIAGKTDALTRLTVSIELVTDPSCFIVPELVITRAHLPSREALGRLAAAQAEVAHE